VVPEAVLMISVVPEAAGQGRQHCVAARHCGSPRDEGLPGPQSLVSRTGW
jgi:hypothetical protein